MALKATRFSFLDEETNVGITDFLSNTSSQIMATEQQVVSEITTEITSMVDGAKQQLTDILVEVDTALEAATRPVKDIISGITNEVNLAIEDIEAVADEIFRGNDQAKTAFRQLGKTCKGSILSSVGSRKKKGKTLINGKNGKTRIAKTTKCNIDGLSNLLTKVAGTTLIDKVLNSELASSVITGIADRAYEIGIPDVFNSITSTITEVSVLVNSGAELINRVASRGDMFGVIDIANSAVGNLVNTVNNGIANTILENFTIPIDIVENKIASFYDEFSAALDIVDNTWNTAQTVVNGVSKTITSLANFPEVNIDLKKALVSKSLSLSIDTSGIVRPSQIIKPVLDEVQYLATGIEFIDTDPINTLNEEFSDFFTTSEVETPITYSV